LSGLSITRQINSFIIRLDCVAQRAKKLRMQLIALDTAHNIEDLDIPGYRLHQLKGSLKGYWSITVNANWRITFEFSDGNIYIVNYEDYH